MSNTITRTQLVEAVIDSARIAAFSDDAQQSLLEGITNSHADYPTKVAFGSYFTPTGCKCPLTLVGFTNRYGLLTQDADINRHQQLAFVVSFDRKARALSGASEFAIGALDIVADDNYPDD